MPHALFAPSSAATWLECSFSARNSIPEAPKPLKTQLAADEGTRGHELLAAAVAENAFPDDNDSKAEAVALGIDFVRQLEPGDTYTELTVELAHECGGTADLFNDHPCIATIMDYKFGKWDVDAYHNKQMLTYAAALLNECDAEWWRLVIFQPNGLDETPFKQWVAHRSEVIAHRDRVLRQIADRSAPRPGPWCRWCNAFQQCPAMSIDAGFVMGAMSRAPESLTSEELVRLLRIIRALDDVKAVYDDALVTKLKLGYATPGAVLKPGRSFRQWNDQEQAAKVLYEQFGTRGIKPISPAQAEKLGPAGKQYAAVGAHKPEAPLKAFY
jgi:Protein of unknown function (DUF2800)